MGDSVPNYTVRWSNPLPTLVAGWDDPGWAAANTADLSRFRPEGSAHRPRASIRLLYNASGITGEYRVHDRYVRSVRTRAAEEIWKDSCVEIFLQPRNDSGYFNLEMNAGGAHLCNYIEDPERVPGGFKKFTPLPADILRAIRVRSSLPAIVDPEITDPLSWQLRFHAPFSVFEHFTGPLGTVRGQTWRGNFYKCADGSSHPHWASWAPVDELNFHTPRCFGSIVFR